MSEAENALFSSRISVLAYASGYDYLFFNGLLSSPGTGCAGACTPGRQRPETAISRFLGHLGSRLDGRIPLVIRVGIEGDRIA